MSRNNSLWLLRSDKLALRAQDDEQGSLLEVQTWASLQPFLTCVLPCRSKGKTLVEESTPKLDVDTCNESSTTVGPPEGKDPKMGGVEEGI